MKYINDSAHDVSDRKQITFSDLSNNVIEKHK